MRINYVLGFVICLEEQAVILLRKNKPKFQEGFYNGIGGKIEEKDESPAHAMQRECIEEIGIDIAPQDWKYFATMATDASTDEVSSAWTVHCFAAEVNQKTFRSFMQKEKEIPRIFSLTRVDCTNPLLLGNITWLVGMAVDKLINDSFIAPILNYNNGLSLPLNLQDYVHKSSDITKEQKT